MSLYIIPLLTITGCWATVRLIAWALFRPLHPINLGFFTLQGMLPKQQPALAKQLAAFVAQNFSVEDIKAQLANPENIRTIMPVVEAHMHTFLTEKLPAAMPVFKMFVGESTTRMIKDVLMAELESLFPTLIDDYLKHAAQTLNPAHMVQEKITDMPVTELEKLFRTIMQPTLRKAEIAGIIFGLITAAVQLAVILCC